MSSKKEAGAKPQTPTTSTAVPAVAVKEVPPSPKEPTKLTAAGISSNVIKAVQQAALNQNKPKADLSVHIGEDGQKYSTKDRICKGLSLS